MFFKCLEKIMKKKKNLEDILKSENSLIQEEINYIIENKVDFD